MPPVKSLYVRDEAAGPWEEVARAAAEEGVSVSEFAALAVREPLHRRPPAFALLTADSMEPLTPTMKIRRRYEFEGRWVLKDGRSTHPGASRRDVWSIAITKGDVFVAHVVRGGETPLLGTDPDFGELERKFLIPGDVAAAASETLESIDWVVRRDIWAQSPGLRRLKND
jgi:hypothetical protein